MRVRKLVVRNKGGGRGGAAQMKTKREKQERSRDDL